MIIGTINDKILKNMIAVKIYKLFLKHVMLVNNEKLSIK